MSNARRNKTLTTVLTTLADRRSPTTRIATGVALVATFFGSIQVGLAGPGPTRAPAPASEPPAAAAAGRRVRPIAIEDAGGKLGADALWKLFDGDASTGLAGGSAVRLRMTFAEPIAVTMVGGFAPKNGRLSLRGPTGDAGGEIVDPPTAAGAESWVRASAKQPARARTFVVDWAPGGAGAMLPELEVWGRLGGAAGVQPGGALADALFESLPDGAESFAATAETRVISVATVPEKRKFAISMPYDPRGIERAFLSYELDQLPHFTAAARQINGGPTVGGFAVSRGAKGGLQVEEISPAALRAGPNTVEFLPVSDKDPVGYRVGRVKLIVVHTADAEATDDGDGPAARDEAGGWREANGAIRHLRFATISQPRELRIGVTGRQPGKLVVAAGSAATRRTTTVDLDKLIAGTTSIALDAFPSVDDVTIGFEAPSGRQIHLGELAVNGSPLPAPVAPALRVTYPLHGECVNHQVHVRGLSAAPPSELRAGAAAVSRAVVEAGGFNFTASEKELGGAGKGEPFSFRLAATIGGRRVETTVPIAGCVDRPAAVAGADGTSVQPREDVGAPYGVVVKAKHAAKLAFAGFELDVPAGAVDKDVRLTVRPLSPDQVPVVDATMTNVTADGRAFRLGPRGMVFKKPVSLSIPVDASKLEPGESPQAFYYDESGKQWREIQVVAPGRTRVIARSDHFTDFIASTLKLPEHPGVQSLDPTSLKQIKIADPGAGVAMIAPPQANAQGTANLQYPIEVPPGRLGMQPSLAISYDSGRSNGWLGLGWDLNVPSIEVDTRFGVPRYDGSERYTIDGDALTPLSQPPSGAPAGTYYARRKEGRFDWIQRVNSSGSGYHWLVTDKAGVKYTYGQADDRRLAPLLPSSGTAIDKVKTFKWFLEQAEDIHGNQVRYTYTVVRGTNPDRWTQVYPASISYTARASGTPTAPYSVVFTLQGGQPRPDSFSTGRPGFQVLTQKLLDFVDVKNGTTIVRRYKLTYITGDYEKKLLQKIEVFGKGSTPTTVSANAIATHTLEYFRMPSTFSNAPIFFGDPQAFGPGLPYTQIYDPVSGAPATGQSLHDMEGNQSSNEVSLLIAGGGQSSSYTRTRGMYEDMDGDGLPDYLPFRDGSTRGIKQYLMSYLGQSTGAAVITDFPGLTTPYTADMNHLMTSSYNLGVFTGSEDYGNLSEATALHIDVNGDGLINQVTGAPDEALHVRLNLGRLQGFGPEIVMPNYIKTGLGFDCDEILESGTAAAPPPGRRFPSADVITKWVAPYSGSVRITGRVTRQEAGGDGMIATLLHTNTKLWEREVGPNDLLPGSTPSSCTPTATPPTVGSGCGADNLGIVTTVAKGDRIYTRVNGIANTEHDGLKWDTTFEFINSPTAEAVTKEAWGPLRYKWTEANDQRVAGSFYKPWSAPFPGNVHLTLIVAKDATADNVDVVVQKFNPSTQLVNSIETRSYTAAQPVDPNTTPPIEIDAGWMATTDEIHIIIKSETPIDPKTIRVLATANYTYACRNNAYVGLNPSYCGYPRCTALADSGGSSCTIETTQGASGPSTDPMAATPLSGAVLNQIIPAYYPLQRWSYVPASTPNPPTTSLDGRKKILTTASNQIPRLCFKNPTGMNFGNQTAVLAIQGVNKLLKKQTINLNTGGEIPICVTAPTLGASGQQIFFSVYSSAPISPIHFTAEFNTTFINGAVDIYYPDPTLPTLDRFPFIGGKETMASGYHNFYLGLWNGNADFDESFINGAAGNANYQPMWQAPIPREALPQGTLAFSLNPLDWVEAAYNYVSSFGKYLWDKAVGLVKYVGSVCVDAIRWLGSIAGKIMAWAFCEIAGDEYQAEGIRVTESHNQQQGIMFVAGVAVNRGESISALDLVDMNGDRYPDQLSSKGVRYAFFDPQTNTGRFCPTPQTSASCGTTAPTVTFPGHKIRDIKHSMHSYSVASSISIADAQYTDSQGKPQGVSLLGAGITTLASQGYSHTKRDLIDINGDGLPDIVEVNSGQCGSTGFGLCVQLNYGYGFTPDTAKIPWTSPNNWTVSSPSVPTLLNPADDVVAQAFVDGLSFVGESILGSDPPTSQTIRLSEEGHKGGQASVGPFGYGLDETYDRTLVDLVDVNGDGLPDQLMKVPGQPFRFKLNTGAGFADEKTFDPSPWPQTTVLYPGPQYHIPTSSVDALSFSRGLSSTDSSNYVVYGSSSGPTNRKTVIELMDIDGDGRVDQVMKNADPENLAADPENSKVWVRRNQTGKSNLLKIVNRPLGGYVQIDYKRETNYTTDHALPWGERIKLEIPDGRWTMSTISVDDNRGNFYEDTVDHLMTGYYDRTEREFFGFAAAHITHVGNISGTSDGSQKRLYFHNQDYHKQGMLFAAYDVEADGRVQRGVVTQYSLAATPNAAGSQYVQSERTLEQPFDGKITHWDIGSPLSAFGPGGIVSQSPVSRVSLRGFDDSGNMTTLLDYGDLADFNDNVAQQIHYATFTGQHFTAVDNVTTRRMSDSAIIAQRDATYTVTNNRPQLTQVRDFVYGGNQPVTGTPYTGQTSAYNFTYDAADFGNIKTFADPSGNTLTYVYDTATKTHSTRVTDSFNVTSSATPNQDFGLPATTTDANGKVVTYNYDVFGRLSKVWGPTDPTSGTATIQMSYSKGSSTAAAVPWALTQHKDFQSTTGDTIDTVTFVDGLGRVIQTKREAELLQANGTTVRGFDISGQRVFDARGRVLAQSQPIFDSATAATTLVPAPQKFPTVYAYDALDRPRSITTADGALTSMTYGWTDGSVADDALPGFSGTISMLMVTDANAHTTRSYRDGSGQLLGNKSFVTIGGTRQPVVTKYAYDLLGNVTTVTDAKENVTSATYDSLSRMVSLTSPDAGRTDWRYALTGVLAEKQTPKIRGANQFIKYAYDFTRLKQVDYPNLTDVAYVYGSPTDTADVTANRVGRLETITMEGGSETRKYDAFGNVSETTMTLRHINNTTLPSPVVTMKYSYDWLGRMRTMTFPLVFTDSTWNVPTGDGEVITYVYDKGGMLDKITGKPTPTAPTENYLNDVGYDEFGSRANIIVGNGINTKYTYSPHRHFLQGVTASGRATSGTVQFAAYTYGYDPVGNVLSISNGPPQSAIQSATAPVGVGPMLISNTYDELDRLLTSNGTYRGRTTFGYTYSSTYTYDTIDNLKTKNQSDTRLNFPASAIGLEGGTPGPTMVPTTYSLTYNHPAGKVHQPATITDTTGGTTRTRTMSFDGDGNNTADSGGLINRTLTWDDADRLKSVTDGTATKGLFRYNPAGERTQKRDTSNTTTFYFNQFLSIDGTRRMTKHLFAGETRIASKTESVQMTMPARHFYHPDHIGSTSYVSDAGQNLVQHERYFPFGERWSETDERVSAEIRRDHLFTGKELDRDTNLYYFGGRYLDPRTSTWLSADPILADYMRGKINHGVFQPRNLGLYAYAWNNPIALTDPDGKSVAGPGLPPSLPPPLPPSMQIGMTEATASLGRTVSVVETAATAEAVGAGAGGVVGLAFFCAFIPTDSPPPKFRPALPDPVSFPPMSGAGQMQAPPADPSTLISVPPAPGPGCCVSEPGGQSGPMTAAYIPPPDTLPAFPDAKSVPRRTPVKGGGGLRKRWKDKSGSIFEWDSQHGKLEKYSRNGKKHLGEFDPDTGKQTGDPKKNRSVER